MIDYGNVLTTTPTHSRLAAKKKKAITIMAKIKFSLEPVGAFNNDGDVVIMMVRSRRGMTKGNEN